MPNSKDLSHLRENYKKGVLTKSDLKKSPFDQFTLWFVQAKEMGTIEANAMTLSTVSIDGKPSNRIVLLKEVTAAGFIFYPSYRGRKAVEMAASPDVAALFFWLDLEQQIRIEGQVEKVSIEMSTKYFQSRPKGSQIGAWVSDQSTFIEDRSELEKRQAELEEQYKNEDVLPLPPDWGGYIIKPNYFEFWQGRESRLHDRLYYEKTDAGTWKIGRLAP